MYYSSVKSYDGIESHASNLVGSLCSILDAWLWCQPFYIPLLAGTNFSYTWRVCIAIIRGSLITQSMVEVYPFLCFNFAGSVRLRLSF